jgi:hypothetical protein
VKEIHSNLNL